MPRSISADAFAHHTWANLELLVICKGLSEAQLETVVPGTYGSIVATLRHLVENDCFDLWVLNGGRTPFREAEAMSLEEMAADITEHGDAWEALLAGHPDPDTDVLEVDPGDGFRRTAPLGIRLAQALHHASEHRTQVCVGIASLGLGAPDLSAFAFGMELGRVTEVYPPA
jgi:uncharacterized damage-inducible protein DinB